MKNVRQKLKEHEGFSYIELLIVIVVISIVASLAIMSFGSSREQFKRQNVAQQLKQAFERARFDSVKRRASAAAIQARVTVNTNSYTLLTDNNSNGVLTDAGDTVTTSFTDQIIIAGPGAGVTIPATISFDQRGEVAASTPIFMVCNVSPCTTAADNTPDKANIVLVTPTGTVNFLAGGATVPTFAAPSNSTLPSGSGTDIKGDVVLP